MLPQVLYTLALYINVLHLIEASSIVSSVAINKQENSYTRQPEYGFGLSPAPTLIATSITSMVMSDRGTRNRSFAGRRLAGPAAQASDIPAGETGDSPQPVGRIDNSIETDQFSMNSFDKEIQLSTSQRPNPKNNVASEAEEVEMYTNNHQTPGSSSESTSPTSGNSRHYNTYQAAASNLIPPTGQYSKFAHSGSHTYHPNNLNLNYIHSLLSKPSSNHNHHHHHQNSLVHFINGPPTYHGISSLQGGFSSPHHSSLSSSSSSAPSTSASTTGSSGSSTSSNLQLSTPNRQHQQTAGLTSNSIQDQNSNSFNENLGLADLPGAAICGRQQIGYREPRIVGGNNTYEGEFPWAVSIQRHGNHHCGGVIVGRRWILTAAHCVRNQLVGNLIVRTGGHTLSRSQNHINSYLSQDYVVDQIVMHDDFSRYDNLTASQMKSSANTNNADIALLRLKHEIHWNELAWPVCFPNREAGNFSGHDAVVIGWGKLNEKSEEFSNELQKVKLTIIDNKVCQNWFRQAGREMPIDDRIICAGFKNGGKDACHGDSGGPLLSRVNGQYVVVGVVSTGIGCARPLLPGLYSRVSSYIGWIERYIQ